MRETLIAVVVALAILYFLTKTQIGADLFFKIKGSVASS